MNKHDIIRNQASHIKRVGDLLTDCTNQLNKRAIFHDETKWSSEEYPYFEKNTERLAGLTYGSDEYKKALEELKPALVHHYKHNSHHPEYYDDGIDGMDLLDLLEMICDWKAASERHNDGSIIRSLELNKDRFKISPQLYNILINTIKNLEWLKNT